MVHSIFINRFTPEAAEVLVPAMITACIVVVLSILWFKFKKLEQPHLPPGPRGLPILGYLLPFLNSKYLHHDLSKLAAKYGPIYKLWLGKKLCVVISSTALAKEVVRDNDKVIANRDIPVAIQVLFNGQLDVSWERYGPRWRIMRKVFVRDMLSKNNLEATHIYLKNEVRKTVRFVYSKIDTPIHIRELVFNIGLNVIMSMLWGGGTLEKELLGRVEEGFRKFIPQVMDLIMKPNISDFFPVLDILDLQGIAKKMKNMGNQLFELLDLVIDQRMNVMSHGGGISKFEIKDEKNSKDFLQILLELKGKTDSGVTINNSEIKSIIMDMFIGGTDTTSTTLEWVMTEILANPKVMERVTQELDDVIGIDMNVKEIHLHKLKYLDAVVKETMRVHPPVPTLNPRSACQSCHVGGYTIPKDTMVMINLQSIHMDPEAWQNPSKFDPERFFDKNYNCDFDGMDLRYFPFGSGRRICVGITLAKTTLMYVVASFLHSFDWKIPNGDEIDLQDKFGIVVKKKIPLVAFPTPRLINSKLYE